MSETAKDHERIWLEPEGAPDRCWCQDNVWGDEATEYIRADRIAALEAELQALRKALEPFAREAENWGTIFGDAHVPNLTPAVTEPGDRELAAFTVGDLRRARLASERNGE